MPTHISEFESFRLYSKEIKKFLLEHAYLSRYPIGDDNVTIEYATPPRAFVKFLVPVFNGGNLNPTITFYLESMEYGETENLLGFARQYRLVGNKYEHVSAPLIYKLNYKAVIMVANPSDADILLYELLAAARKNKKHFSKVDGQWVEIVATNPTDDSPVEPGENDKVYKRSVILTIPRAYLPMEYIEYGIIEQINVKLETLTDLDSIVIEEIVRNIMVGIVYSNSAASGSLITSKLLGSTGSTSIILGNINKKDNLNGRLNAKSNAFGVI